VADSPGGNVRRGREADSMISASTSLSDSFKTLGRIIQMIRRTSDRSGRVESTRCGSHIEDGLAEKCRL
jgi:hypothetical protein